MVKDQCLAQIVNKLLSNIEMNAINKYRECQITAMENNKTGEREKEAPDPKERFP